MPSESSAEKTQKRHKKMFDRERSGESLLAVSG